MAWIIIIGILLVAIGPVLYVMPSKRDKQLIALRSQARTAGLTVDISHIPDLNATAIDKVSAGGKKREPKIKCATYTLMPSHPFQNSPCWHLGRSKTDNVLVTGWGRIGAVRGISSSDDGYWARIGAIINALPGSCIAVKTTPHEICWQGLEHLNDQAINELVLEIKTGLEKIVELHDQIDKERQTST